MNNLVWMMPRVRLLCYKIQKNFLYGSSTVGILRPLQALFSGRGQSGAKVSIECCSPAAGQTNT